MEAAAPSGRPLILYCAMGGQLDMIPGTGPGGSRPPPRNPAEDTDEAGSAAGRKTKIQTRFEYTQVVCVVMFWFRA